MKKIISIFVIFLMLFCAVPQCQAQTKLGHYLNPNLDITEVRASHILVRKRKDAVARVWIKPGHGNITVNDKTIDEYFARPVLKMVINQPFVITNRENEFDVICTVKGGGLSGQAGAIRHGISKALNDYEPELRSVLKQAGFLTRDDRVVERKKYGKAKARRSYQFSKR